MSETTTPEPEPSEREALARAIQPMAWTGVADSTDAETRRALRLARTESLVLADRALAWFDARPAPVVSAEAVEAATTRLVESGEVPIPWDATPRDYVQDAIAGVLAALGITVADTPAADDEGGQGR